MANAVSFLIGNLAQSTVSATIGSGDASFVLGSSASFAVPASGQQGVVRVDDVNNANYNQLTGPFEIMYFATNTVGTNTLSGLVRGQDGTTPHAFSAGAKVTQCWSTGPFNVLGQRIFKTTLGGTAASVAIAAIPGNFTDLWLSISGRGDAAASNQIQCGLQFNGDTAAGDYVWDLLSDAGNAFHTSNGGTTATSIAGWQITAANAVANMPGAVRIWIPSYSGTTFWKQARIDSMSYGAATFPSAAAELTELVSGVWNHTAAITSITVFPTAGNFVAGTTVAVYAQ